MQGLADGYFVIPYTLGGYIAGQGLGAVAASHQAFRDAEQGATARIGKLLSAKGKRTPSDFHRQLGQLMWDNCGMGRNEERLKTALAKLPEIRDEFWKNVIVSDTNDTFNQTLEKAMRAADFLEFGELLLRDALGRRESCGGHFREEMQTEEGEAKRDDENFSHVAAWEYTGEGKEPALHKEPLQFEYLHQAQRSYK
jgi:succinate dehydrogenase / fumarate reductase flavoprotein subunit